MSITELPPIDWTFGDVLSKIRRDAGLTGAQLAELLDVSERTIGNYERDNTLPKRSIVRQWAVVCGYPYADDLAEELRTLVDRRGNAPAPQWVQGPEEGQPRMKQWHRFALIAGGVALAAFALCATRSELRYMPTDNGMDTWHYTRLASGYPVAELWSPFRNRPLMPTIVGLLPMSVPWGFAIVTAVFMGVGFAAVHETLRKWWTPRVAWVGLGLLASVGSISNMVVQPNYVDAATFMVAALAVWFLAERWGLALVVLLPLGVAAHELTLVLLIPVCLTAWRQKRLPDAAVGVVAAIGVWWFLHRSGILVPVNDRANMLTAPDLREAMLDRNAKKYGTVTGAVWSQVLFGAGVLAFFAPFGWKRGPQIARDCMWMLVPCSLLAFQALDWRRLMLPLLPALTVLACATVSAVASPDPERARAAHT